MWKTGLALLTCFFISGCAKKVHRDVKSAPLSGLTITLDPGHGDTAAYDDFRLGPTGEREEWINLRVAKRLKRLLERSGARVVMTRTRDRDVSLGGRAALALIHDSDLLVSIHHNGSSDPNMDYPLIYFWGEADQNPASVDLAKELVAEMQDHMTFNQQHLAGVYSDHLIYPRGTSILRNTYSHIPGIIGECGFFTHAPAEKRLKSRRYNDLEARVYHQAIVRYVSKGLPSATPLVPDDQKAVVTPDQGVVFKLSDGLGGHRFIKDTLLVRCDGEIVSSDWDEAEGQLAVTIPKTSKHHLTFQVFARNVEGNALHPKKWTFLTPAGREFQRADTWHEAFEMAESVYAELEDKIRPKNTDAGALRPSIQKCLDLYRLSLKLQAVHVKSLRAEQQILQLLKLQRDLYPELDMSEAIADQQKRLTQYYPYVSTR